MGAGLTDTPPKTRRLTSECGILELEYASPFLPEDGDMSCGNLVFNVFGVNTSGNGSASYVSLELGKFEVKHVQPVFEESTDTLIFNLPDSYNATVRPQVLFYNCKEGQLNLIPPSRSQYFANGTLRTDIGEVDIITSLPFNIGVFGTFQGQPSPPPRWASSVNNH
jgi:hypothetical protein